MFTGIVTDIGEISRLERHGELKARIVTGYDTSTIDIGASIACDGICLTTVDTGSDFFDVEISVETVSRTTAGDWQSGRRINLERSLKVGDELGGHIVSGHVDGVATIVSLGEEDGSARVMLDAPDTLARFIAPKGSIALNGVSLTVNEVEGCRFGVNLIPHTRRVTTMGGIRTGDRVNLEIDTLARYVARLREWD